MRRLLAIVLIAAGLWGGYWFVGSSGVRSGFEAWFEARRAEGWVADYADFQVQGFPNRFDTSFNELALADPATGLAWEAPFFQLLALSYKPNHIIAVWPDNQLVSTPLEKFNVQSDDMRASLVLRPDTALALDRTVITAQALSVAAVGDTTGRTRAEALSLAAERVEGAAATYRLGLTADGFAPALNWRKLVDPGGTLPDRFDALSADLTVAFDKPWDRTAIEDARPQPQQITLKLAQARWGQLELQAAGALSIDAGGTPTGEITIKASNWRDIIDLAVASGALPEGLAGTLKDGLSLISQMAGNPKTLDIPLGFRRGRILLGPVPIGPAPVLRLR